jgi:uncharacterized membrane protein
VVGWCLQTYGNLTGFLYNGTAYTVLKYPGAFASYGAGISSSGLIDGYDQPTSALTENGFKHDGSTYTLVVPPGALTSAAFGINDNGQIVGTYQDTSGNFDAFIPGSTPRRQVYPYVTTAKTAKRTMDARQVSKTFRLGPTSGGFYDVRISVSLTGALRERQQTRFVASTVQ